MENIKVANDENNFFFFIPHQIKHALSCEINIFKKIMLKLKTKF